MSDDRKLWILRAWDGVQFATITTINPDLNPDGREALVQDAAVLAENGFTTEVSVWYVERDVEPLVLGKYYSQHAETRPFDITSAADWKIYDEVTA